LGMDGNERWAGSWDGGDGVGQDGPGRVAGVEVGKGRAGRRGVKML